MGLKALRDILPEATDEQQVALMDEFEASRVYNKRIGNLYTGSLYLSLYSLLDNSQSLKAGDRIGMFSYGSGAEGEFYSLTLRPHFSAGLVTGQIDTLLANRQYVTIADYEKIFNNQLKGAADREFDFKGDPAKFVLHGLKNEQRQYICN